MMLVKYFWPLSLIGAILVGLACENIALIGRDPVASENGRNRADRAEITGTVDGVDTRSREIYVRSQAGRTTTISYSPETRVSIGGRESPISELRRNDEVTVQLRRDDRGYDTASVITVRDRRQAAADLSGVDRQGVQTIEGTVERVNFERGYFEVRPRFGSGVTRVFLPYNPVRKTEDQFRRLREGDYVRVEGELVSDNRVELKAFL